ncbi:MAG TPA: penicillin-binding transpeptidase domain-containing protein [Pyrinomonadaceae bacterium]|nr:penicillin-binding transpeptidase domain-containing protein [Pyrinomonadaceae bacterium]
MTPRLTFPLVLLLALTAGTFSTTAAAAPRAAKKSAPAAKSSRTQAKSARASKADARREKASPKKSAREQRADRRANERGRKAERASDRRERASKNDRRANAREERRASARNEKPKDLRRMSKRERAAELARRRREEAARRAEIARQAAIARAIALARQRAADQALRDETVNNILKDDTTGEDLEVRRVAVEALGNHAGTVVVMDPKDGRVYTAVNQDWALRKGFKPCSTIKLVSGLAGVNEGVISPLETVNASTGSYRLDLTDSLAYSNNGYFQRVGGQVGFEKLMTYARQMGLGETTGINHVNESPGRLPLFKTGYAINHMSSHGDDIEVTPIQLANMTSAIANGGTLLVPHLPRTPEETFKFKREVKRKLDVPQESLRRLMPGMVGAVNYGTARGAQDPTQTVAGKTGTCIGQGSWLGLFASYAPVQDPKLAVVVVTRGSGERGRIAAAVAGRIYRGLNHRFGNRGARPMLANDIIAPRPKIDPSKAAAVSDEDKEADEAAVQDAFVVSEADKTADSATTGATPQSNVRSTVKTYEPKQNSVAPSSVRPSATPTPTLQGAERPRRVSPQQ